MKQQSTPSPTKLKIAKEAEKLFAQKGYAATSMEDITNVSESSKGSIYYHFKSKEKLFLYIVENNADEWKRAWNIKQQNYRTSVEKLYALADHYLEDLQSPLIKAAEEFGGSETADPEIFAHILEIYRSQYYDTYEAVIDQGIKEGAFIEDNPKDLMYILFGMHAGLNATYYEMEFPEIRRLYHKSVDVFLKGISKH
ncbi:TetR family transcriptional regulator C-terminal domain-containing protein [Peribacillus sp. NPDC097264]|uniref:TetR/AcrR family transcriptional regulator n=1 Tax=Peribacillus sp. NPDC097264 TaxID=3390616 RepID=UPI003D06D0A3